VGHRARDQQQIGMTRRGHEAQAEALEIVERIVEGVDLELASRLQEPASNLADRQAAAETFLRERVDLAGELRQPVGARIRPLHRARSAQQVFSDDFPHGALSLLHCHSRTSGVTREVDVHASPSHATISERKSSNLPPGPRGNLLEVAEGDAEGMAEATDHAGTDAALVVRREGLGGHDAHFQMVEGVLHDLKLRHRRVLEN
jgi:hypothetical protein